MPNARLIFSSRRLFNTLLGGLVLALYAASFNFGLIWDDPNWYQQGAGQSLGQLFTSLDTYQFYRPLAIGLNRLLVAPSGVVAAPTAHFIQIVVHLIATLAVAPVLQALKIDRRVARASAVIFAINPLAYQAVAWQAPQQPIATLAVFVSILAADRFLKSKRGCYLGASIAAYAFALLFQESALPFVWVFGWLAVNRQVDWRQRRAYWPGLHVILAFIYFLIWLNVPRQAGVTGRGLDARVLAYVLQGVVFPIAGAGSTLLSTSSVATLTLVFAAIVLLLLSGVWAWRGWRHVLIALGWLVAGSAPVLIGLSWSYVRIGSRLMYPAALGVALLWGSWAALLLDTQRAKGWRLGGGLIAALIGVVSITQWLSFQTLYQTGTQFMDRTIAILTSQRDQRLLFVNYPDRLELRPAPYPLGNWGLILAPVVQDLADFAAAKTGGSAQTQSLSAFQLGAAERGMWPYTVAMRGEDTPAEKLHDIAAQADRVYVVDYAAEGQLHLREVGAVRTSLTADSTIATFGAAVRLSEAQLVHDQQVTLTLTWQALTPLQPDETIFIHHWRAGTFISAYDGDSLGGLLSPALWRSGEEIVDVRHLSIPDFDPARDELRIGLYNRQSGARQPAVDAQGQRLPDEAATLKPQ